MIPKPSAKKRKEHLYNANQKATGEGGQWQQVGWAGAMIYEFVRAVIALVDALHLEWGEVMEPMMPMCGSRCSDSVKSQANWSRSGPPFWM